MDTTWSGKRMPRLPERGEWVRWRNPRHARTLWWDESYGPGPFEVVRVVDHSPEDLPHGILLKTRLGEREINEVWLALPSSPAGVTQAEAASVPHALRVLVAGDRQDTGELLKDQVARLGHQVFAVDRARQLIDLCRATQPDLVLIDIHLPDGAGIATAVEVFREQAIPFVLVCGPEDTPAVAGAPEPIMAYLVKPVREADLAAAIILARSRFEQQRTLRLEVMSLQQALEERKLLDRAKGIAMKRLHIDEATAYQRIRKLAGELNRKLVDVARDVIRAEEVYALLDQLDPRATDDRARKLPARPDRLLIWQQPGPDLSAGKAAAAIPGASPTAAPGAATLAQKPALGYPPRQEGTQADREGR